MTRVARTAVVGFLVAAALAPAAWSQDANTLIDRGVELRAAGRDEAALQVFRQSWEAVRSPRALAQIALAEQALGRWVDAETHLAEALSDDDDPWVRRRWRALQPALGEIRRHVGRLEVQGNVPGAEVVIGDRVVGVLPLAAMLHVQTGTVTVTVRAAGYSPVTRALSIEDRTPQRVTVTLVREATVDPAADATLREADLTLRPDGAPTSDAAALPRRSAAAATRRAWGYGLIGVGAASLVVAGVFFGLNANHASETRQATPASDEPYASWARFQASENAGRALTGGQVCALSQTRLGLDAAYVRNLCASTETTATVALAAGLAGGALAVTGLVLALTARPTAPRTARWGATPWLARGTGGATVGVVW